MIKLYSISVEIDESPAEFPPSIPQASQSDSQPNTNNMTATNIEIKPETLTYKRKYCTNLFKFIDFFQAHYFLAEKRQLPFKTIPLAQLPSK